MATYLDVYAATILGSFSRVTGNSAVKLLLLPGEVKFDRF